MMILELDNYESFGTPGSGNQTKFWINNQLVKLDSKFRESDKEVSASKLADVFNLNHITYSKIKALYKNQNHNACICDSYLDGNIEEEISIYNLLNLYNVYITQNESSVSYFDKVIKVINIFTGISESDIKFWLLSILTFDYIICNTDRHLSNLCVIHNLYNDTYKLCPIFDNGQSFLNTNGELTNNEIEIRCRKLKFKPFSTNAKSNLIDINYAKDLVSQWESFAMLKYGSLINMPINSGHNKIIRYRINQLKNL